MTKASGGQTDTAIPQLRRLTHRLEAATLLCTALLGCAHPWVSATGGAGPLEVRAVTVLRGHPGSRWTLRYVVQRGDEECTLIAKVYARDRGDVAATLSALRHGGFGAGQCMQVAAPIAYLPMLRLLLLEEAPGETACAALGRGQVGGRAVGEWVARWLAAFHAAAPPLPAVYRWRDPLIGARRWAWALGAGAPTLTGEARHLLAALAAARPAWPAPPHLVHGDFSASHVYLAAEVATVIDWDAYGVGGAAEDAGRFLASLHHLAARDHARRAAAALAAETFTQVYRAALPAAGQGLAFYEALACLRTAKRLTVDGIPHRVRRAEALLAAGEQALVGSR
ncbi:MAG TPA: phosphotransferase [Chloroflexota bacterium]|nr:phosphotransferase [Chloroflexota bacterium]